MESKLSYNKLKKQHRSNFTARLNGNAITNLSTYTLTATEQELLTKGLSYVPQYNTNHRELGRNFDGLIQNTHTDFYFKDRPPQTEDITQTNQLDTTDTN